MRKCPFAISGLAFCLAAAAISVAASPPYVPIGEDTGVCGAAVGFFHVERIGNRDWIVDPVGRGVYLSGVDWCMPQGMFCEPLDYAPYGKTVSEKYASRDEWAEVTAARLSSWGFNFLAVGTGPQMLHRSLAHANGSDSLYFSTHLCSGSNPDRWISPYRNAPGTAFPNVFNPGFAEECDALARSRCAEHVGDPWLVGYFLDNEIRWQGLGDTATGLFDLVRTLSPEHTARQALERFVAERTGKLTHRHGDAEEDPATLREIPAAVKRAFVAEIAERYFSTLCAAIRKADPNHLVLGSRFAGLDFAPEILSACGRHCDVVSVNVYPWADLDDGVVLEKRGGIPLADAFRAFHEKTGGKPLLLTEWSFPALDSGLPCTYGAGQRFQTQAERAQASEMFLRTIMALPFFVGDDFFMWQDDPALGFNKDFRENSNYGLVNVDDEPYEELTEMFTRVHRKAAEGGCFEKMAGAAPATASGQQQESERERFFAKAGVNVANVANDVNDVNCVNPVAFAREGDRWSLSNGLVRISGRIGGSRMADEIAYGDGPVVGRWNALLQWKENGSTQWTGVSRVTDVSFESDSATGIGTATIRSEGSSSFAAFAITDRLSIAPGSTDILAEIVRLENTGDAPINVEYLMMRPFLAEAAPKPAARTGVPNLWKGPVEGWWQLAGGACWGVSSHDPGIVSATMWFRKEDGTQHPDVRCLGVPPFTLASGAAFEPPLPVGALIRHRPPQ